MSTPAPHFPNFTGKHEHDSIITPRESIGYWLRRRGLESFDLPKSIVLCYSPWLMSRISLDERFTQVSDAPGFGTLWRMGTGSLGVAGNFGVGAPTGVMKLEELAALGAERFLNIGYAGSLRKGSKTGDVFVCERAIRDEGVSHHYSLPDKYSYPSRELTEKLKSALDRRGTPYLAGPSWTIDAPYRETVEEARHYQAEGVLSVEMEASAVFTVAAYRVVEAAAAFVVSDSLAELTWDPQFGTRETREGLWTLCEASFEALAE